MNHAQPQRLTVGAVAKVRQPILSLPVNLCGCITRQPLGMRKVHCLGAPCYTIKSDQLSQMFTFPHVFRFLFLLLCDCFGRGCGPGTMKI